MILSVNVSETIPGSVLWLHILPYDRPLDGQQLVFNQAELTAAWPVVTSQLEIFSTNSPVSQLFFPLAVSSSNNVYLLINRTTNCWLYSNMPQILLLYIKYGGIITNFIRWNPCGILLIWKRPQWGCVEHVLKYFSFYVKKRTVHLAALFWTPRCLGSRQAARGARISETPLLVRVCVCLCVCVCTCIFCLILSKGVLGTSR